MGLLNKLKNVLFEEEEIEETVEEPKVKTISKNTMEIPKITKEPKKEKYDFEEETDRELFKAEKTFDFPVFDEEEFDDFVPKKKEELPRTYERETEKRRVTNNFDNSRRKDYTSTRIVKNINETPKKAFKPSPVISPVYGILDKNYKKEDVVTRDEMDQKKTIKLDVDSVRKKAFGTLEEDLQSTLSEPIDKFYEEVKKEEIIDNEEKEITNLEELLDKTIDAEIDVTKEMEIPSRVEKANYEEDLLEETIKADEVIEEDIKKIDPEEVEDTQDEISNDTLENDLFELIDSMYENREDEE